MGLLLGVASAGGCLANPDDDDVSAHESAVIGADCSSNNPRVFEQKALNAWKGLKSELGPANLQIAQWMSWLSAATYPDDFGDIEDPGFLFRCGFHHMGYGNDRPGTYQLSSGTQRVTFPYKNEGELWWNAGSELKQLVRACGKLNTVRNEACAMRDALEKNLFTELPQSRAIGKLHGQALKGMKHFEQGTTQAFFLHDPDRQYAVVAFRGTQVEVTRDILADVDVRATDLGNGVQVHSGFHHALHEVTNTSRMKSTAELLLERLDYLPRGTELYLTGHSLGGALATLFASEVLAQSGRPYILRGLYTFGAPASGNENFAKLLNDGLRREKAWHGRFTYGGDIVPGSTSWTAGYVHSTNYDREEPRHAQAITLGCKGNGYELTEQRRSLPCEGWVGIDDHDKLDYFSALKVIVDHAKTDAALRIVN